MPVRLKQWIDCWEIDESLTLGTVRQMKLLTRGHARDGAELTFTLRVRVDAVETERPALIIRVHAVALTT